MIAKAFKYAISNGMEPDSVADKVVEAIKTGQFYILTHDDTKELVRKRMEGIINEKNPLAELPAEFMEYFGKMN